MKKQLLLFVSALCAIPAAPAATIYNFETYGNTLDGPPGTPSGICTVQSFTSQTLATTNCSSAPGVLTSAEVLATYGALHAFSSLDLRGAILASPLTASGYARTVDSLVVSTPGVAFMGFTFQLDGTLVDSGLTQARVALSFGFNYDGGGVQGVSGFQCAQSISSGSQQLNYNCSTPLYPISLFNQYSYFYSLSTQETNLSSGTPVIGAAVSNFFNTAAIASVQTYDAGLQFIPGAVVSSVGTAGSNFAVTAAVPEPSTLLLGCSGLVLLAASLRKGHGTFPMSW